MKDNTSILIVFMLVWAAIGLFITPTVYRKRGLNPWAGALVGTVCGALGGILLLGPLWFFAGRNRKPTPTPQWYCAACGKPVRETSKFCPYCGIQLVSNIKQPVPTPGSAQPNRVVAAKTIIPPRQDTEPQIDVRKAGPRRRRSAISCLGWLIAISLLAFIAFLLAWPYVKNTTVPPLVQRSLPPQALAAIDEYQARKKMNLTYAVLASQQATRLAAGEDEAWCIIIQVVGQNDSHAYYDGDLAQIVALREALHWSLQERLWASAGGVYNYPGFGMEKEDLEKRGCNLDYPN